MTRRTVKDRWMAAVLASDLNNSTKVVLWALAIHMTEEGRVKRRRDDLAEDVGQANPRRISDRIKEARDAGFLVAASGGLNGQVVQYFAQLPGSPSQGPSSTDRRCGLQGPSNRDPQPAHEADPGSPPQGPIRVRVSKTNPDNGTHHVPDRVSPNRLLTSVGIDHGTTGGAGAIEARPSVSTTGTGRASA